jgi:hypothetical protein
MFGNPAAVRSAEIGNASFHRALKLGYSQVTAQQFSRVAKRDALPTETPAAVALRIVPPRFHSATLRGGGPRGGFAA